MDMMDPVSVRGDQFDRQIL